MKGLGCPTPRLRGKGRDVTTEQQQTALFILGIVGFGYLLVWFPVERDPWPFVVLIAGMLGIPAFIRADKSNGAPRLNEEESQNDAPDQ